MDVMPNCLIKSFFIVLAIGVNSYWAKAQELGFFSPSTESFGTYAVQFYPDAKIPENVHIKYQAQGWSYVIADRQELYRLIDAGIIQRIYIEPIGQQTMNDSSRFKHFVNEVHAGQNMDFGFTGKGVIIGYVDTGLDYNHLDFKDSLGNTRVLRYWDQIAPVNFRTPDKYGYGQAFTNDDINAGINPSYANGSHGTTVTGCGSGNAMANGRQKGMAPESAIVVVRSNFNAPSWTLTVAEAVDYIFCVADTFNMPAVVNLSLGTYLGSHDGRDPAGLYIDSLLNDKEGRIVVCSAGNSGSWAPYHVQKEMSADTNFVWMIPNAALGYGGPGVYMDLWANADDIGSMNFAFGADAPGPVYRGNTDYHQVNFNQPNIQYDTIWGSNGPIGYVLFIEQLVGPNYNLQAIVYTDSLLYRIRFLATGSGKIDMWSSAQIGGSNFSTTIPDVNLYPEFAFYMMPDTEQSIVSSWACSEQVITVGNIHNRKNYIASNNTVFPTNGGLVPAGVLVANSSKGPNRLDAIKPDIVASGDMSLSARVLNVTYAANQLDIGAMHVRNGGTSMASPVVAGIAGLYLEKCPFSTWEDFKTHLLAGAFTDNFTGPNLPNNAYGYGKAHALNTLLQTEFEPEIVGSDLFCPTETTLNVVNNNYLEAVWNTGDTTFNLALGSSGVFYATVTNQKGCRNISNSLEVLLDTIAPFGLAPSTLVVSCFNEVPEPNINEVTDLTDNCSNISVLHLNDSLIGLSCEQYVLRTYRIMDLTGNFTDLQQQISIVDDVPPFGIAPAPVTVSCVDFMPQIDINAVSNVSDNCSSVEVVHLIDLFGSEQCPQTVTRKYRIFDTCGNFYDANQIITILDTIPPYGEVIDTTFVPCLAAFPEADIEVVQNFGDNCLFESIQFLDDTPIQNDPNMIYRTFLLSDACGNTSEVVQVLVISNTFPAPSVITFDGQFLNASQNFNYQWYLNGTLMPGAIEPSFVPSDGGFYAVSVVDEFGCISMSDEFFVSLLDLSHFTENELLVFPNPTDGQIRFQFSGEYLELYMYDLAGNLLKEGFIASNDSWDLSVFASGVYFISFGTTSNMKPIKIVKN
jgi:subtilisin family serine protease